MELKTKYSFIPLLFTTILLNLITGSYSVLTPAQKHNEFVIKLGDLTAAANKDKLAIIAIRNNFENMEGVVLPPLEFCIVDLFKPKSLSSPTDDLAVIELEDLGIQYTSEDTAELQKLSSFFIGLTKKSRNSTFANLPLSCDLYQAIHSRNHNLTGNIVSKKAFTVAAFMEHHKGTGAEYVKYYTEVIKLLKDKKEQTKDLFFECSGIIVPKLNLKIPKSIKDLDPLIVPHLHAFFATRPQFNKDAVSELISETTRYIATGLTRLSAVIRRPVTITHKHTPTSSRDLLTDKSWNSSCEPILQFSFQIDKSKTRIPFGSDTPNLNKSFKYLQWIADSAFSSSVYSIEHLNGYIQPTFNPTSTQRPLRFYEFLPANLLPAERKRNPSDFSSEFVTNLFSEIEGKLNVFVLSLMAQPQFTPFLEEINAPSFDSLDFNAAVLLANTNFLKSCALPAESLTKFTPLITINDDLKEYIAIKFAQYGIKQGTYSEANIIKVNQLSQSVLSIKQPDFTKLKTNTELMLYIKNANEVEVNKIFKDKIFNSHYKKPVYWLLDKQSRIKYLIATANSSCVSHADPCSQTRVGEPLDSFHSISRAPLVPGTESEYDNNQFNRTITSLIAVETESLALDDQYSASQDLFNQIKKTKAEASAAMLKFNPAKYSSDFKSNCLNELKLNDTSMLDILTPDALTTFSKYLADKDIKSDKIQDLFNYIIKSIKPIYEAHRLKISKLHSVATLELQEFKEKQLKQLKQKIIKTKELIDLDSVLPTCEELNIKSVSLVSIQQYLELLASQTRPTIPLDASLAMDDDPNTFAYMAANPSPIHLGHMPTWKNSVTREFTAESAKGSLDSYYGILGSKSADFIKQICERLLVYPKQSESVSFFDDLPSNELPTALVAKLQLDTPADSGKIWLDSTKDLIRIYSGLINSPLLQCNVTESSEFSYEPSLSFPLFGRNLRSSPKILGQIKLMITNIKNMLLQRDRAKNTLSLLITQDQQILQNLWLENNRLELYKYNDIAKANKLLILIKQVLMKTVYREIKNTLSTGPSEEFVEASQVAVNKLKNEYESCESSMQNFYMAYYAREAYTFNHTKLKYLQDNKFNYDEDALILELKTDSAKIQAQLKELIIQQKNIIKANADLQIALLAESAAKTQFNNTFIDLLSKAYDFNKELVSLADLQNHQLILELKLSLEKNRADQELNYRALNKLDIFEDEALTKVRPDKLFQVIFKHGSARSIANADTYEALTYILLNPGFKTHTDAELAYSRAIQQLSLQQEEAEDTSPEKLKDILRISLNENYAQLKQIYGRLSKNILKISKHGFVTYSSVQHTTMLDRLKTLFVAVQNNLVEVNTSLSKNAFSLNEDKINEIISLDALDSKAEKPDSKYGPFSKLYKSLKDLDNVKTYSRVIKYSSDSAARNCDLINPYLSEFVSSAQKPSLDPQIMQISAKYIIVEPELSLVVCDTTKPQFTSLYEKDITTLIYTKVYGPKED